MYAISIDSVRQHPDNSRKHRMDKLMQSLTTHGQRSLIVVQKSTGFIVKGNGTWAAAKQLGWSQIAASIQDMDDTEALGFLVDDNRASDLATYEKDQHLASLQKLMALGAQGTLFTEDDIADLEEELRPLAELQPKATNAAGVHELAGGDAAAKQAEREAKSDSDTERLKDVRFPLTLADHALFMERIRDLQKRYGTPGAIATLMEAVKRQAEAEQATGLKTGRQLDEAAQASAVRGFATDMAAMLYQLPGETVSKAHVLRMLGEAAPAPVPEPDPLAVVPGQLEAAWQDELNQPVPAPQVRDWSQSSSAIPLAPTAGQPESSDER